MNRISKIALLTLASVSLNFGVMDVSAEENIDPGREYSEAIFSVLDKLGPQYDYDNNLITNPTGYSVIQYIDESFIANLYDTNNFTDYKVESDGDPVISDPGLLYVGETILSNDTDQELPLSTSGFSKEYSSSVSSALSNAFSLSSSASASFGIPLVGQTEITLTAQYDFTKTDTNTDTETYTYSIPSDTLPVPPHTKYLYKVELNTVDISGNVKASMLSNAPKYDGEDSYYVVGDYYNDSTQQSGYRHLSFGGTSQEFTSNLGKLLVDNNIDSKYIDSLGRINTSGMYKANYGTTMKVTVTEISNINKDAKSTGKIIKTYQTVPKVVKQNS